MKNSTVLSILFPPLAIQLFHLSVYSSPILKSSFFWDIRPWSSALPACAGFLLGLLFNPEDGGDMFPSSVG
jgi:hypothetical protein